jgi:hypothetical protein
MSDALAVRLGFADQWRNFAAQLGR